MRLLFDMDLKDYDDCTHTFVRNSARSIIIRDGKLAMIRETREEAGLVVLPESVREYGYVHRIQRSDGDKTECFVQDNYYYLCDTDGTPVSQQLDEYEEKESYELEYVDPAAVIVKNRSVGKSPYNTMMFERDARVVELLIAEGVLPHR